MRAALLIGAALMLAGCQTVQTRPIELSESDLAKVRIEVMTRLKDPDSARFGKIAAGRADNGTIEVCGTVSGRNALGAYGNPAAFQGWLKPDGTYRTADIAGLDGGASWAQAILNNCLADGVPI